MSDKYQDQYNIQSLFKEQGDRQSDEDEINDQDDVSQQLCPIPSNNVISFGENRLHFNSNSQIFLDLLSINQMLTNDLINRNHFMGRGDELYSKLVQIFRHVELHKNHDASVALLPMLKSATLSSPQTFDEICPVNNGDLVLWDNNDEIYDNNEFPNTKHVSESSQITERFMQTSRKQEQGICFQYGPTKGKIFSENEKDYIEWEVVNDRFIQINAYQFCYGCDSNTSRTIYVRKRTTDHLVIIDEEKFIAEIKIDNVHKLEFFDAKTFQSKQKIIQNLIKINRIIDDNASDKRNNAYDELISFLRIVSQQTSQNLEFAEDFFQFSIFQKTNKLIDFLSNIVKSDYISIVFKNVIEKFLTSHKALYYRCHIGMFRLFIDNDLVIRNLYHEFLMIYDEGINQHRKSLNNYSNLTNEMINDLNELIDSQILQLSNQDAKLFSDLLTITSQHKHPIINVSGTESINILWKKLITKIKGNVFQKFFCPIKSLSHLPLTNSVYLYLFKSCLELMEEISNRTNIPIEKFVKISGPGKLKLTNDIVWPVRCTLNRSLEKQFSLILNAMEHFIPGNYSKNKIFEHKLNSDSTLAFISDERKIWYYILHDTLREILNFENNSSENFQQILNYLLQGYRNLLIKSRDDRFESFRVCAHSIVKFSVQICPYFCSINSMFEIFDQKILKQQIEFLIKIISKVDDESCYHQNFINLIDIFNEYWQHRELIIDKIPQKYPYIEFESILKEICEKLLTIVSNALDKTMHIPLIVNFFRVFIEFLKYIEAFDLQWLVNETNSCIDKELFHKLSGLDVVNLINDRNQSYHILNPKLFIEIIKFKGTKIVPRHYVLDVLKRLLDIIIELLTKHLWYNDLNATSDLILAIGHSFIYVKDQNGYVDYDNFYDDSTKPFASVIKNSLTYSDLKRRLENIEKFYVYSRKQDEIDLTKALDLYEQEMIKLSEYGFKIDFNRCVLVSCYEIYENQFKICMEIDDIEEIIDNISTIISENISSTPNNVTEWTEDFKQNTIPLLLAGVAAVWSIFESKDIACTKKTIKPHCIQILCILRLLNVDNASDGIENHLAQVLTGQGKSIVLGLLSSLIALTGHNVEVVCYSDYLANRDQEAFSDFFELFELNDRVTYKTFEKMANGFFNISANVSGRKLAKDLILNKLEKQSFELHKIEQKTFLLIDEVDVFFTDEFYGATYNPAIIVGVELLTDIQTKIWELVNGGVHDSNTVLKKIHEFIDLLRRQTENEKVKELVTFVSNTQVIFENQLKLMIDDAICVANNKHEYRNYKINDDGMICRRQKNGIYCPNTYCSYWNVFHYFRLKKACFDHKKFRNYGYLNFTVGEISYAKLPLEYAIKLGVSGTLTTLNNPEKDAIKSYNINTMSSMPSFFGRTKLVFDHEEHFNIQDTDESWLNEIFNRINVIVESGRSVLVFFAQEDKIYKFQKKFQSNINRLNIITGNEPKEILEWYINESGVAQTVTLGTRQMGRGVDYKSNDSSVEKNGGVHVIQTFFSLDEKEEIQIKGRTARKDNAGSYELILCREHLKEFECFLKDDGNPIENYEELCVIRKNRADTQGMEILTKIQQADEKHSLTKEFLKSLSEYTPENRKDYISKYPFAQISII